MKQVREYHRSNGELDNLVIASSSFRRDEPWLNHGTGSRGGTFYATLIRMHSLQPVVTIVIVAPEAATSHPYTQDIISSHLISSKHTHTHEHEHTHSTAHAQRTLQ